MTNNDLIKRIEELERRVCDLEARPVYVPAYIPVPCMPAPIVPSWPYPYRAPWESPWYVTCTSGGEPQT